MEEKFKRGQKEHEWDVCAGKGGANIVYMLSDEDIAEPVKITEIRAIKLDEGAWCGYHEVTAKSECYYIAAGEGVYKSDSYEIPVKAGDTVTCDRGGFHGLTNTGKGELTYVALTVE